MKILSGKDLSAVMEGQMAESAAALAKTGRAPKLAVIRAGDDPATGVYVRNKMRAAGRVGILSEDIHLPEDATQAELEEVMARLNRDPAITSSSRPRL